MRGVIYARYSSDNQREESIEGQIRENTAFARKNGIDIVDTYIDRAYSAKTDNRPEFQRMIKDSGKKSFDVVIVWKLDRFSRNRYDSAKYKAMLKKNDVRVLSATEAISEGAEGIILESVLEGMAEYYSADLAEKVTRGMTENALKCRFNGGTVPFGYMIDEEQHYQINPAQAPLVIEMFRRYAGGESITEIIEDLNARGIRTSRGNRFNKNSIARIFSNRRYIGEYAYKDIAVPDAIPAIVCKDIFDRVAIRMGQNKHATGKAKAPEKYLLTTKLFCGTCYSMFVGDSANKSNGVIYRYYKCASAKRHECDRKALRKDWTENIIIEKITSWLSDDKTIDRMADDVMALLSEENEMIPALEAQLKQVRSSIDNIMKAIEQGIVTRTTRSRLEELEREEESLTANIRAEEAKKPKISKEFIIFTLDKFRKLDLRIEKNKERLIDGLVKAIIVHDDRFEVFLTFDDTPITIPTSEEIESMKNSSDIASVTPPWRVFLQHLKGCKNTRFLYSEFTGGVVDDYAFSCIYGHFRDRQGQHRWNLNRSDAVIVDAKPLLPYAVDLLSIEHFNLLNQFVQHPGRQFPRSGVLADKTDKHICRHGTAALLLYLGAELFYFLRQLLLLVLIPPGHFCEAVIGELAGNIVLIDALKKAVQFFITGKERS